MSRADAVIRTAIKRGLSGAQALELSDLVDTVAVGQTPLPKHADLADAAQDALDLEFPRRHA